MAKIKALKNSAIFIRYCGNCHFHDVYDYPSLILCKLRYLDNKDFIVPTLSSCEKWTHRFQECYCVKEASKKQNKT